MEHINYNEGTHLYDTLKDIRAFIIYLERIKDKESTLALCSFIAKELKFINAFVGDFCKKSIEHLPLPEEEPQNVKWFYESSELPACGMQVGNINPYHEEPQFLFMLDSIQTLTRSFEDVMTSFDNDNEDRYKDFGERYIKRLQASDIKIPETDRIVKEIKRKAPGNPRTAYCLSEIGKCIEDLRQLTVDDVAGADPPILHYDIIGRHLWSFLHSNYQDERQKADDIKKNLSKILLYSKWSDLKVKFRDYPMSYLSSSEQIKLAKAEEKENCEQAFKKKAREHIKSVVAHVDLYSDFFDPEKINSNLIEDFLLHALEDEETQSEITGRLKSRGYSKFACEILRQLYEKKYLSPEISLKELQNSYRKDIGVNEASYRKFIKQGMSPNLKKRLSPFVSKYNGRKPPTE